MILCDREIQALLDRGLIGIDPRPDAKQWSSTAVDLTLSGVVLEWIPQEQTPGGGIQPIVPHSPDFDVYAMMENPQYARRVAIDATNGYILQPRAFVLGFTREAVRFPHECRIAARVEGKSSLARLGLGVHVTAPTIHAGFGVEKPSGEVQAGTPIQLEIFNVGPWPIRLDEGMRICQLILEEVREVPIAGYHGQFNRQRAFISPPESSYQLNPSQ
ncbi:MAG: hypothetical protein L0Z62_47410 [Gemmataceae bacterium]|nr:hypothetical protein [Gemmataceae bacterium]